MSPHEIAAQWYSDLVKAELVERGSAEATEFVDYFLRLAPLPNSDIFTILGFQLQQRTTDYELRLNAHTGELLTWYVDELSKNGNTEMPASEALELARWAGDVPLNESQLEANQYETMADRTFYRARWRHVRQGLRIEGDYIEVLINGRSRKPFFVGRVWRLPNLTGPAGDR